MPAMTWPTVLFLLIRNKKIFSFATKAQLIWRSTRHTDALENHSAVTVLQSHCSENNFLKHEIMPWPSLQWKFRRSAESGILREDGRNVEKREAATRRGQKRLRDFKGDWSNLVKEGSILEGRTTELFGITLLKRKRTRKTNKRKIAPNLHPKRSNLLWGNY